MQAEQNAGWAVVLNPTKFDDVPQIKAELERVCADHGWSAPEW